MTPHQLDLFAPKGITPAERIPPYTGWLKCACGLVFWESPMTRRSHGVEHDRKGAPDLRPWHGWTCWRGIKRMTPTGTLKR